MAVHCVKSVQIRSYFVNLRIQSEYRKIQTRNNSVFGHFSSSAFFVITAKRSIGATKKRRLHKDEIKEQLISSLIDGEKDEMTNNDEKRYCCYNQRV